MVASILVALAIADPGFAQGKGRGKKPGKTPGPPPSRNALPPSPASDFAGSGDSFVTADPAPFAWMDDASLMPAGSVWLGVSMMRWQGSGYGETIVPVFDAAVGLAPRVQLGATVPRVEGGLGAMFFSGKVGVFADEARGLSVAVSPTLEVIGRSAMQGMPDERRTEWGVPVSAQIDRDAGRIYGSSGYFSPGIWYAGAGMGTAVADRVGVSMSFSRAWARSPSPPSGIPILDGPRRNEISAGVSYDLQPNIAVFGSLGRTLGLSAEDGAGTTLSFGVSMNTAAPILTR
jgi:hypothetical protein